MKFIRKWFICFCIFLMAFGGMLWFFYFKGFGGGVVLKSRSERDIMRLLRDFEGAEIVTQGGGKNFYVAFDPAIKVPKDELAETVAYWVWKDLREWELELKNEPCGKPGKAVMAVVPRPFGYEQVCGLAYPVASFVDYDVEKELLRSFSVSGGGKFKEPDGSLLSMDEAYDSVAWRMRGEGETEKRGPAYFYGRPGLSYRFSREKGNTFYVEAEDLGGE